MRGTQGEAANGGLVYFEKDGKLLLTLMVLVVRSVSKRKDAFATPPTKVNDLELTASLPVFLMNGTEPP
jgi:hypothetical protein